MGRGYNLSAAAFIMILASPASAGVNLAWNACATGVSPAQQIVFQCDQPDAVHTLYAGFRPEYDIGPVFGIQAIVEVRTITPALPPFWQMGPGGCNEGLALRVAKPSGPSICPDPSPWGAGAASVLTYEVPTSGPANRARILVDIARPDAVVLDPLQQYYAFHLDFSMESGESVEGCDADTYLALTQVCIMGESGSQYCAVTPDPFPACVEVNGTSGIYCGVTAANGPPATSESGWTGSASVCDPTAVRHNSWGTIKSLYR